MPWVQRFLTLFQQNDVNIRRLSFLESLESEAISPHFKMISPESRSRLEMEFEVNEAQEQFFLKKLHEHFQDLPPGNTPVSIRPCK
ncbi:MAG: hypothetical protein K2X66_01710 [Cyanobacteria bacterium]|nr:hypothetical protein [Cyanobacteriota bacterium]